jgi:hypothetical protein
VGICAGVTPGIAAAVGTSAPILSQIANLGADDGACANQLAYDYATQADKLDHIFAAKHGFDPLVQEFGTREAVVGQILQNIRGLTPSSGTFNVTTNVGGQSVVVGGSVVNGVVKIGTAFTPTP